jgi:hypothetical protein
VTNIDDIDPAPWGRCGWTGGLVSLEGCPAHDFTRDDVAEVIAWGSTGDEWDGDTAGIMRLHDGRFVAWEATFGPTGNGFICDAYGGDTDIMFAATEEIARRYLGERARELLG